MEKAPFEPRLVGFLCNWCSYAGADLAGVSRLQYPPNVRIVRVMCSGRVDPLFVLRTLVEGADGVLVSGWHPGDCHYVSGNMYADRRFRMIQELLGTLGLEPKRVRFAHISSAEGTVFSKLVDEYVEELRALGPNPLKVMSNAKLRCS